jgi:hypothetical protein
MRTMSETALYGKVCGFMILKWLRRVHSLKVLSGSNQKIVIDSINVPYSEKILKIPYVVFRF